MSYEEWLEEVVDWVDGVERSDEEVENVEIP